MVAVKRSGSDLQGVLYVATGRQYVDEAIVSAGSVKKQMPDLSVTLFTDNPQLCASAGLPFDNVRILSETSGSCRDKIHPLIDAPYEKSLFLDTDTYVCRPLDDVFEMLDNFDIALAHAPDRYQYPLNEIPDCFTELNSGVIAFRKNEKVKNLLLQWEATFFRMLGQDPGSYRDQHSLRDALYRSDVRFLVLPPEYNFRTICPNFAGKHCDVKIIHGRHHDFEKLNRRLNKSSRARVFLTSPFQIWTADLNSYDSAVYTLLANIYRRLPKGVQEIVSAFKARLVG